MTWLEGRAFLMAEIISGLALPFLQLSAYTGLGARPSDTPCKTLRWEVHHGEAGAAQLLGWQAKGHLHARGERHLRASKGKPV